MELRCSGFRLSPLEVELVSSSFFNDPRVFPGGSVAFDSAFSMREVEHEWHGREPVRAAERLAAAA